MSKIITRGGFLLLVMASGIAIGILTAPGDWYVSLNKPFFNPPNWVFGPVWTVIYILIAMAGWRTWEARKSSFEMKLWWVQLGLNFLWSPTFFALQQPWLAFAIILSLLFVILMFIRKTWNRDRVSALAFIPYALWVAFASTLNLSIAILN